MDNVWIKPLDGSAGHAITDFKSEHIWSLRLSPDGKSLAVLRGHFDSDVVLLQEARYSDREHPHSEASQSRARKTAMILCPIKLANCVCA